MTQRSGPRAAWVRPVLESIPMAAGTGSGTPLIDDAPPASAATPGSLPS